MVRNYKIYKLRPANAILVVDVTIALGLGVTGWT